MPIFYRGTREEVPLLGEPHTRLKFCKNNKKQTKTTTTKNKKQTNKQKTTTTTKKQQQKNKQTKNKKTKTKKTTTKNKKKQTNKQKTTTKKQQQHNNNHINIIYTEICILVIAVWYFGVCLHKLQQGNLLSCAKFHCCSHTLLFY